MKSARSVCDGLRRVWILRRILNDMNPVEAIELLTGFRRTRGTKRPRRRIIHLECFATVRVATGSFLVIRSDNHA
jgi:hypothetical protein